MHFLKLIFLLIISFLSFLTFADPQKIVIGSKMFGENYLLSEILAQYLEDNDFQVDRKLGLGGTLITFEALRHNEIQIYPEYTGTFAQAIMKDEKVRTWAQVKETAAAMGLTFHSPLGFNNTYAIAARKDIAEKFELRTISDLKGHEDFLVSFNFEFFNRKDGWPNLKKVYGIEFNKIKTLEQTLAYQALGSGQSDIIVVYSTDGKVLKYDMRVLEDDKDYFPKYEAAFLSQSDLPKGVERLISNLSGIIDQDKMIAMNARVDVDGIAFPKVANEFLIKQGLVGSANKLVERPRWQAVSLKILSLTWEHIYLVFISTFAALIVGVPLGIMLFRFQKFADPVLYLAGMLQTIPSLALLVYMIPLFGVSVQSALMALFLYSLLPILQNTYSGLQSVSPQLIHAAQGIGLYRNEILLSVELPLAAPIIIAGVRVAAVINVGTATIAAFIGSGGLGELIVQGLTLNDLSIMQQGAIPAAVLAIAVNIGFTLLEKKFK